MALACPVLVGNKLFWASKNVQLSHERRAHGRPSQSLPSVIAGALETNAEGDVHRSFTECLLSSPSPAHTAHIQGQTCAAVLCVLVGPAGYDRPPNGTGVPTVVQPSDPFQRTESETARTRVLPSRSNPRVLRSDLETGSRLAACFVCGRWRSGDPAIRQFRRPFSRHDAGAHTPPQLRRDNTLIHASETLSRSGSLPTKTGAKK